MALDGVPGPSTERAVVVVDAVPRGPGRVDGVVPVEVGVSDGAESLGFGGPVVREDAGAALADGTTSALGRRASPRNSSTVGFGTSASWNSRSAWRPRGRKAGLSGWPPA